MCQDPLAKEGLKETEAKWDQRARWGQQDRREAQEKSVDKDRWVRPAPKDHVVKQVRKDREENKEHKEYQDHEEKLGHPDHRVPKANKARWALRD